MPSTSDRTAARLLFRTFLLATIVYAVYSTFFTPTKTGTPTTAPYGASTKNVPSSPIATSVGGGAGVDVEGLAHPEDATTTAAPGSSTAKAAGSSSSSRDENVVVVASIKGQDTSWLDGLLPGFERRVYLTNIPLTEMDADRRIPLNKGHEGMVYLSYIIDNYDTLPPLTLFLHNGRYQWHNDDPIYDGARMLRNLKLQHIASQGYANLRCCWTLGCPAEIVPNAKPGGKKKDDRVQRTEDAFPGAWRQLFGKDVEVPAAVGTACCAQFGATRDTIRQRPRSFYVAMRDWLVKTELEDEISGRILEYTWHVTFGKPAVHCPNAKKCYCDMFGYCDIKCNGEGVCPSRYTLPPFATLPKGWPMVGWDGGKGPGYQDDGS